MSEPSIPASPPSGPARRSVLRAAGGFLLLGGTWAGRQSWFDRGHRVLPLLSDTVALSAPGHRRLVRAGDSTRVIAGSRVLRTAPDRLGLLVAERDWLGSCGRWTRTGRYAGLVRSALLDLHVLGAGQPAPVASWSPPWRYVWPRDTAYVAAALAVAGRPDVAARALSFLQRVQRADGWFEARYLPDGSGPPDDRPPQLDGTGWALWGCESVCRTLPDRTAATLAERLRPMICRSLELILEQIEGPSRLPQPSPDYWERPESEVTLGTAAPLAAGLWGAARLLRRLDDGPGARRALRGHRRLTESIRAAFSPGFGRYAASGQADAAVTFLLPPYSPKVVPELVGSLLHSRRELTRPAGGLAPGSGWHDDGISWTPETGLFALAAAETGDRRTATRLLDWLDTHRTQTGSLPEKVLYDGRPASVAPLAWTAALAVLTAHRLR